MAFRLTALITLAMLVTYFWTGILVGQGRGKHKVKAPAIEGPDEFNRIYRAHVNTLEQLVLMLPALWLFAITVGDQWAAVLGLIWIAGRTFYVMSYIKEAEKRGPGFGISFAAFAIAVIGSAFQLLRGAF
jgi:glutathione S-transferase